MNPFPGDTGERRRRTDRPPVIGELIDEATVRAIADDAWLAMVGEDEVLVPLPGDPPAQALSAWVEIVGPWTGSVVLTTGRGTAEELCRALLRDQPLEQLEDEDVEDAMGELANVLGGNVKAALPGHFVLGLPEVGDAPPPPGAGDDNCRVEMLWRGRPVTISVQGAGASPREPAAAGLWVHDPHEHDPHEHDPHGNEVPL